MFIYCYMTRYYSLFIGLESKVESCWESFKLNISSGENSKGCGCGRDTRACSGS